MSHRERMPGMRNQAMAEKKLIEEHNEILKTDRETLDKGHSARFDIAGFEQMSTEEKRESLQKMFTQVEKLYERAISEKFSSVAGAPHNNWDNQLPDISTMDDNRLLVMYDRLKNIVATVDHTVSTGGASYSDDHAEIQAKRAEIEDMKI